MFSFAFAKVFVFRKNPDTDPEIDAVHVLPPDNASLFNMKILKKAVRSEQETSESM